MICGNVNFESGVEKWRSYARRQWW